MTYQLAPILAATTQEIITWSVVLVIMVGSWVAKQVKESQGRRSSEGQSGNAGETDAGREQRLQELAARRREQLRQMSQQRGTQPTGPGEQPTNLTSAQHGERARARTLYERRAEALRRAQSQGQPAAQPRPPLAQPVGHAQAREPYAATEARAAEPAHAHTAETERHQQAEQAQRQQRLDSLANRERDQETARERVRAKRDAELGAGARNVVERSAHRADGESSTRRIVADAESTAYVLDSKARSRFQAALQGRSLRDAIVLKEILGRPLALRQGDELL